MNKLIITIVFLLFICTIQVESAEVFNITTVEVCYGTIEVKVEQTKNIEYEINGCEVIDELSWKCDCKIPITVAFETTSNKKSEFDFVVQYYVKPVVPTDGNIEVPDNGSIENDNNRRTEQISDIIINGDVKLVFPKLNLSDGKIIVIVVSIVIIIFGTIIFFVIKWLFKSEVEKDKVQRIEPIEVKAKDVTEKVSDDDEFLKSLIK